VDALEKVERALGLGELLGYLLALDEERTSVDADERDGEFREGVQFSDCTGNCSVVHLAVAAFATGGVAGAAIVAGGLCTSFDDGDVVERECTRDCTEEGDLLAGGFEERERELRQADGERNARKAAAGADVDHLAIIWELCECLDERERIEDVLAPSIFRVGDGGEVENVVCSEEHREVATELFDITCIELDAQLARFIFKARRGRDGGEGGEVGEIEGCTGWHERGALGAAVREVVVGRFGARLAGWAVGHWTTSLGWMWAGAMRITSVA
jgi:hypothetical protein